MSYFKLILFYFFEVLGSLINLAAAFFGLQPTLDLGVSFLCFLEEKRIKTERELRLVDRQQKEAEAGKLENQAKKNE